MANTEKGNLYNAQKIYIFGSDYSWSSLKTFGGEAKNTNNYNTR